jgi:hypothetical protein
VSQRPDEYDMPKTAECQKVIKFWVDYCHKLEKQIEDLKEELRKYRGH